MMSYFLTSYTLRIVVDGKFCLGMTNHSTKYTKIPGKAALMIEITIKITRSKFAFQPKRSAIPPITPAIIFERDERYKPILVI
mgnify:FL=1